MGYSMVLANDITNAEERMAVVIAHNISYTPIPSPAGWRVERADKFSWNIYHRNKYIANVIA